MEQTKFLKFAAAMLCGIAALATASCDKDDDEQPQGLKLNPTKVEVVVGETADVAVSGGTAPYTATTTDKAIATASVKDNTVTVTGVKKGSAVLAVTDKNNLRGSLSISVVEKKSSALSFDKQSVEVAAGKEDVVTISGGAAPYTVTTKDAEIATASEKDGKLTVKGVKAGATTITVQDKDKKSGTIAVTVK